MSFYVDDPSDDPDKDPDDDTEEVCPECESDLTEEGECPNDLCAYYGTGPDDGPEQWAANGYQKVSP